MANNNNPFSWQNGVNTRLDNIALNMKGIPPNPFSGSISNNLAIASTPIATNKNTGNVNIPVDKVFMPELEGMQNQAPIKPQVPKKEATAKFNPKQPQMTEQKAQSIYNAYINGEMDEQAQAEYEADILAGKVQLPFTADVKAIRSEIKAQNKEQFNPNNLPVFNPNKKQELPKSVVDAYNTGKMDAIAKAELEQDLKDGIVALPKGVSLIDSNTPVTKFFDKNDRLQVKNNQEINNDAFKKNIIEYVNAPEFNKITSLKDINKRNLNTIKGFFGSILSNDIDEKIKILENNFPNIKFTKTKDGSAFFKSPTDGKYYGINKGKVETADIVGGSVKALPYAVLAPETIAGSAVLGLGTELATQATKKATGGNFDVGDVAESTVLGGALSNQALGLASKGIKSVINKAKTAKEAVKATKAIEPTIIDIPQFSKTIDNNLIIDTVKKAKDGGNKAKVELNKLIKNDPEILNKGKDLGIKEILSKKKLAPETAEYIDNLHASAGAMATNKATIRQLKADNLPVPIKLTKGQVTRNFAQLQFEKETAKNAEFGLPLREQAETANNALLRSFDAYIDDTGAKGITNTDTGIAIDKALRNDLAKTKNQVKVAYKNAEKAGELKQPVSTGELTKYLNDNNSAQTSDSILAKTYNQLVKLGGATKESADPRVSSELQKLGKNVQIDELIPQKLSIGHAEDLRKFINKNVKDADNTDLYHATNLIAAIDKLTENKGGELYKSARKLRIEQAKRFENRAVISDLINNKKNSDDRKIALENMHK